MDSKEIFKGSVVLVTGGSRGIGKAIVLEFASRGANVVFNYLRSHDAAIETQRQVEEMGVECLRMKAHLGDVAQVKDLFANVSEKFGKLDVLVNNAASGVNRSAMDLDERHWDWTFNINARAPWLCSMEAADLMTKGGSIVNITSLGSQRVLPNYFSVGTSKAALESVTRYLAVELGTKEISVNAVSAGYVETNALEHFPNREEMLESGRNTPAGRMVQAVDVARVVAFLCSEEARMIRGQVIFVDGGMSLIV